MQVLSDFNWRRKKYISTPTKNYILKKFHEATTLLKQQYVEAAAPDQTDEFISQVLNSSNQNSDEEKQVSSEILEHLCTFKQSDSFGKTIILSLINHKKNIQLASIFNCSKYLVQKACKWKLHSVGIEFLTKIKIVN